MICGSSSRGSFHTAKAPTRSEPAIIRGVSFDEIQTRAKRPAGPRDFIGAPRRGRESASPAGTRHDHLLAGGETRQDFQFALDAPAGGNHPQPRLAVFDHEDLLELAALDERVHGDGQDTARGERKRRAAEDSRADIGHRREVDLDRVGPRGGIDRGNDLGDVSRQRAVHRIQCDRDRLADPDAGETRFIHRDFEAVPGIALNGEQWSAGRGEGPGLDRLGRDNAAEGSGDAGVITDDGRGTDLLVDLSDAGIELGPLRAGGLVRRLRCLEARRRFVELLSGD